MVAILDTFVFDHFIGAKRTIAAKIQEQFDCYVLEFDCSPLKSPDDVTEADVYRYYGIHDKTSGNIEKLIGCLSLLLNYHCTSGGSCASEATVVGIPSCADGMRM